MPQMTPLDYLVLGAAAGVLVTLTGLAFLALCDFLTSPPDPDEDIEFTTTEERNP